MESITIEGIKSTADTLHLNEFDNVHTVNIVIVFRVLKILLTNFRALVLLTSKFIIVTLMLKLKRPLIDTLKIINSDIITRIVVGRMNFALLSHNHFMSRLNYQK